MDNDQRNVAVAAVLDAMTLCRSVRETLVSEETLAKKDRSPVTVADFGAQAVVNMALHKAFPGDGVVGEEDASQLRRPESAELKDRVVGQVQALHPAAGEEAVLSAIDRGCHGGGADGRYWVLDPIDGTKGFLRGEQYAVALALVEKGRIVLGLLGCPNLPLDPNAPDGETGCLFIAEAGKGTVVRGRTNAAETPVRTSGTADPGQARVCESVESGHTAHGASADIAQALGITLQPCRMDSQCKYAAVARGEADIYLRLPTRKDYQEKIWDHAAGWLVVTEAGGRVTDVGGKPLDFTKGRTLRDNRGVVATNGPLHDRVVRVVANVLNA